MTTKFFKFLTSITVVSFPTTIWAIVDCEKDPIFSTRDALHCCQLPKPNWTAYEAECTYDGQKMENPPSPCTIECIFNVSKTLQNGVFIKPNARIMLSRLFINSSFADAYLTSFDICQPLFKRKMNERMESENTAKRSKTNIAQPKCSPVYLYFALCLRKYVFVHCPANAWVPTKVCEKAKEHATVCNQTEMLTARGNRKSARKANRQQNGPNKTSTLIKL